MGWHDYRLVSTLIQKAKLCLWELKYKAVNLYIHRKKCGRTNKTINNGYGGGEGMTIFHFMYFFHSALNFFKKEPDDLRYFF